MRSEHIETVIIGAGQAGLATGYHLQRRKRPFVILDGNTRVGDNWREQWDTLRLYTPAKYDGLPGMAFPASPWDFPLKEEVADFLEAYAARFDLPVRMGERVQRLTSRDGSFVVETEASRITADNVVVATGTFGRTPYVPEIAGRIDPSIVQLHSSQYRRPAQLPDGPVLVVGASHSGTDVAYEVAESRSSILCGRDCGQMPFRLESPKAHVVFPVLVFLARHVLTRRTPIGRKAMQEIRAHGGPMLRVQREDLADRGVERVESRLEEVQDGRPVLDGEAREVASIVWCTGFQQDFGWIDPPLTADGAWPKEYRGVVADRPGLFFCGLSFQYAFSSMVLPGVDRDACFVATRIAKRSKGRSRQLEVATT